MAPVYIIVNRSFPSIPPRAVLYNGLNRNLILVPLDEENQNQHWVIKSFDEPTTIVPRPSQAQQAVGQQDFVITEVSLPRELWEIKLTHEGTLIEEIVDPTRPVPRVWGGGNGHVGDKVTLDLDQGQAVQRWTLYRVEE